MKKVFKLSKIAGKMDVGFVSEIREELTKNGIEFDNADVYRKNWLPEDADYKIQLEEGSRSAVKYVSTRTVDQVGDVIVPKGVNLNLYRKTGMPVFWNHNLSLPPIGSDSKIAADDFGIKATTRYGDTGEGTLANIIFSLVQQGHQKQSSVGIIPLEVIREDDDGFKPAIKALSKEWPEFGKNAKAVKRLITKSLLFEHSDVSLGCNTDTDVLAVSKAFVDNGADEELLKRLGLPLLQPIEWEVEEVGEIKGSLEVPEVPDTAFELYDFGESIEIVDKAKIEEECELAWKEHDIELIEAAPEKVEEVFEINKVFEKVELVEKAPERVELVQKAIFNREEIKKIISDEVRRKMGRLI